MTAPSTAPELSRQDMEAILAATRALAEPFDLMTMLAEVTAAACRVLRAERGSVWLHDNATDEVVLEVASDIGLVVFEQLGVEVGQLHPVARLALILRHQRIPAARARDRARRRVHSTQARVAGSAARRSAAISSPQRSHRP